MTAIHAVGNWLDDRLNPVMVKELRQAVRSWSVIVVLMLFLVLMLLSLSIYLLALDDPGGSFDAGQTIFMILEGILLGTCLLFVPAYVGFRLAAERSDQNVDLLYITTIRPVSIAWGKLVCGLVLTLLIYSVCAPFMVLTYLLRGIDLPTIFLVLAMNLLPMLLMLSLAILVGALPVSVVFKVILSLLLLVGIVITFIYTMMGAAGMVFFGVGGTLASWDFWGPALAMVLFVGGGAGLFYVLSVAALSPPSSNRAPMVRLYVTALIAGSAVPAILATWSSGDQWAVSAWFATSLLLAGLMLIGSACERDDPGPRLQRAIPRRWVLRPAAFLLYSGSAGGVAWALLLGVAVLAAGWAIHLTRSSSSISMERTLYALGGVWLYIACYVLTAMLIHRYLLPRFKPVMTCALALLMLAAGSVLPMLIAFFIWPTSWYYEERWWWVFSVVSPIVHMDHLEFMWIIYSVTCLWLILTGGLMLPWLARRIRQFTPLVVQPAQPQRVATADAAMPAPEAGLVEGALTAGEGVQDG